MDNHTLAAVIALSKKYANEITSDISDDIAQNVTNWLDNHVDPDTGYVIDNTLTIQGAAADSKEVGDANTELKNQLSQNAIPIVNTASGAIASFSDGADDVPVKDLVANIEPVQDLHGQTAPTVYEPYSNICPISGWTGMNVQRTGKNLLDPSTKAEFSANTWRWHYSDGYVLKKDKTYNFSWGNKGNNSFNIYLYIADFETGANYNTGNNSVSYTPTEDIKVKFQAYRSGDIPTDAVFQLELGSTATAYEPYSGQTYNVDWETEAGTVYGGTLDVTTGVLTVDMHMITLDGTQGSWNAGAGIPYWRFNSVSANKPAYSKRESIISNQYDKTTDGASTDKAIRVTSDNNGIYVYDSRFVDSDTAVALLSESPVEICYPLLTAKTYQLTPTEVKTLLKQNNIFADTGDIASVEYVADTKTYIDNKFAELQALILENA